MADPELMGLAVTQLLDNACKYSAPGTPVTVATAVRADAVVIRVTNQGSSIRPEEQERIFGRFARGADKDHRTPGSGLGLYVARKIVRAHGGEVQFDRDQSTDSSTTFRIQLPVFHGPAFPTEQSHEQEVPQSAGR
jgi:two-component system sensor histidine kinase KdpD